MNSKSAWRTQPTLKDNKSKNFRDILSEQKVQEILKNDMAILEKQNSFKKESNDFIESDLALAQKLQVKEDMLFAAMQSTPLIEDRKDPDWAEVTRNELVSKNITVTKHNKHVEGSRYAQKMQGFNGSGNLEGLKVPSSVFNHFQNRMNRKKL
ncbi:hypothetical protein MHBO_002870 [Bonamia ostreae]|uniref:Uncharacterized protein n=1 Tax=Bonamia ostreae TaxID=126728 RepID=A0ABV2ANU0_9EUKA